MPAHDDSVRGTTTQPAHKNDTMITKRILPLMGAIVLGMMVFTGCQDSATVAPTSSGTDDALYRMYSVDDAAVDAFAAVPASFDEALNTLTPASNPPGRGGDDSTGNGGRGGDNGGRDDHGGLSRGTDLVRILRQLNLTDSQWIAIRGCFNDYKECVRTAMARYRAAIQSEREELRAEVARLKAAVENGDLTPEEARAIYRRLMEGHRATARDLKEALRTALENCRVALIDCIKSHLTDEQLARWERLTGSGPGRNG